MQYFTTLSTPATPTFSHRLILASGSAYRKELLQRLRLPFEVMSPEIDESSLPEETPVDTAMRLAQAKAEKIAEQTNSALVIGSDQVATLDNLHIGKPGNHANALAQLRMMRGRSVVFHTALCLIDTHPACTMPLQIENIQTVVTFRDLPDAELDAYLKIEQAYDCAGSAKNEGLGITLIAAIEGTDPTALTGLPLIALTNMLRNCGVSFF